MGRIALLPSLRAAFGAAAEYGWTVGGFYGAQGRRSAAALAGAPLPHFRAGDGADRPDRYNEGGPEAVRRIPCWARHPANLRWTGPGLIESGRTQLMFEAFYESFWQHPLLLWVIPFAFLFVLLVRSPETVARAPHYYRALVLFTVLTIIDPLVTGPVISWLGPSSGVADAIMIFFVILGDFRWFFFFECFRGAEGLRKPVRLPPVLRALAWSFLVPVLQALSLRVWPEWFDASHKIFLVYELLFFLLVLGFFALRRPVEPGALRSWKGDVCAAALGYYGLWATADLLILTLGDIGYGLRVVPNQLYYACFLPFVHWRACKRGLL